eukprot:TRINITY_DN19801_c0_g2_i1.p3 TRINITY_DN19801_c0_g2~~TRINITY_DN19801_c0_g2_i1.p3  ORF type:complete len:210 (-),score=9.08 TRINITY_DN19801_c0_g2_i1:522-1061(-)
MSVNSIARVRPVAQAALTSAVVMGCGDLVCQAIQQRNKRVQFDWNRSYRFAVVGLTLHGPFFYFGFRALDSYMGAARTLRIALKKTAVGQFTLFPSYVSAFFLYMGLLEQQTLQQSCEKVKSAFLPTMYTGTVFWPIVNIFNFMYVPATFRVAYVNILGLIWNAYLSWSNTRYGRVTNP